MGKTSLLSLVAETAALAFAVRGWPVFPVHSIKSGRCTCGDQDCASPGKHPLGSLVPHGLMDATTDQITISKWWQIRPDANVGIVTGAVSGLVVLDVDPRHGGRDARERLVEQCGPLSPTFTNLTGGGGQHHLYRHPGGHIRSKANAFGEETGCFNCPGRPIRPAVETAPGGPAAAKSASADWRSSG